MYKVWKASINEYRVQDMTTKEVRVLENISLKNCRFKTSTKQYNKAKEVSFANSDNPFDYFAWIECDKVKEVKKEKNLLSKKVFYNPFKNGFFRDRETLQRVVKAKKIVIHGNTLSYEQ